MAKGKKGGSNKFDGAKIARNIRTSVSSVKPKMTYQYAVGVDVKFVSKLNYGPIIDAGIQKGNQIIQTQLTKALNDAMESSIWKWTPGVTTNRKNGELIESPRNIIDTGALQNSLRFNIKGNSVDFAYREPYSRLVHWGGYIQPYGNPNAKKVYVPGRPWITSVLNGENGFEAFPFKEIWSEAIKKEFRSR